MCVDQILLMILPLSSTEITGQLRSFMVPFNKSPTETISYKFNKTSVDLNLSQNERTKNIFETNEIKRVIGDLTVTEPFPWLESINPSDSLKITSNRHEHDYGKRQRWIKSQLDSTDSYFHSNPTDDYKQKFVHKIMKSSRFELIESPFQRGSLYFFYKKIKSDLHQFSLFCTDNLHSEAKLAFDPNSLTKKDMNAVTVVHGIWISNGGTKLAYGFSSIPCEPDKLTRSDNEDTQLKISSDDLPMMSIRVMDLERNSSSSSSSFHKNADIKLSNHDYDANTVKEDEIVHDCNIDTTNVSWLDSRSGFFYNKTCQISKNEIKANDSNQHQILNFPDNLYANRVFFHRLGSHNNKEADLLIYESITEENIIHLNTRITSDCHYLLIEIFSRNYDLTMSSSYRSVLNECRHSNSNSNHAHNNHSSYDDNLVKGNKLYYIDLSKFDGLNKSSLGNCIKIIDTLSFRFDYISNIEDDFWFRTNFKAPNFRVVRMTFPSDIEQTQDNEYVLLSTWKNALDWIPERFIPTNNTNTNTNININHNHNKSLNNSTDNNNNINDDKKVDSDFFSSNNRVKNGTAICLVEAFIAAHTVLVLKYYNPVLYTCDVLLFDLTQSLEETSQTPVADLPHPPYGTIYNINCDFYSSEIFYQYSDLSDPCSIYRAVVDRDIYSGAIEISFDQVYSTNIPNINKYEYETSLESYDNNSIKQTNQNHRNFLLFSHRESEDEVSFIDNSTNKNDNNSTSYNKPKPCVICVTGGFGVHITPIFSLPFLIFAKYFNGIIVLVNLESSFHSIINHTAGATAQANSNNNNKNEELFLLIKYLVSKGYTSYSQIGLYGGSHLGGVIIGSFLCKHPMNLGAAVIENGIFDLMNYSHLISKESIEHHYSNSYDDYENGNNNNNNNIGSVDQSDESSSNSQDNGNVSSSKGKDDQKYNHNVLRWEDLYGSVEKSLEDCIRLLKLSPLHNIRSIDKSIISYPAIMLTIHGDNDNNNIVSSIHSMKFLAEIQRVLHSLLAKKEPILLYTEDPIFQAIKAGQLIEDESRFCSSKQYEARSIESLGSIFAFFAHTLKATYIPDKSD
eukprot:gene14051-18844_t